MLYIKYIFGVSVGEQLHLNLKAGQGVGREKLTNIRDWEIDCPVAAGGNF